MTTFLLGTQNVQLFLKRKGDGAAPKELRCDAWGAAPDIGRVKLGEESTYMSLGSSILRAFLRVTGETLCPKIYLGKDKSKINDAEP